jgi:BrxA
MSFNMLKLKDNNEPKLKTTLASSGLLLPELSALFTYLEKNVSYQNLRKKVVDDNILSKPSIQSSQVIWGKLSARYKFNDKNDLFQNWLRLITQSEGYDLAQLATLRWAQSDLLLRFLWREIYLLLRNMEIPVQSNDIIDYIHSIKGHSTPKRFFLERSENVQTRIAQHFLLILRDCGAAKGKKNKTFSILPVGENASRYAVRLAKYDSPGSNEILDHWALRWWGDSPTKADDIIRKVEYDS